MTDHEGARAGESTKTQGSGGGAHGPDKPKVVSGWITFFAGLAGVWIVSMLVYWGPNPLYAKKIQPFDFNHAIHTEDSGMGCDECHRVTDQGRFLGTIAFKDCLDCHNRDDRQNEDNARETEFIEQFIDQDNNLVGNPQWLIYSAQPDCVYFSHTAHTEMGGFECSECHGDHGQTKTLPPLYVNRITGYTKLVDQKWKMTDCGDCHTRNMKPETDLDGDKMPDNNACFVCHK